MEKVKLTREVAEAMDRFQHQYGSETLFRVEGYVGEDTAQADAYDIVRWMRKGNYRTYYTALVNGYEVEETPEEKVRGLYSNKIPFHNGIGELSISYRAGIRDTLDALNIKIKGVND
jgi:hypothetical protein